MASKPRFEIRTGKFGQYFHDTAVGEIGYDMPLATVLARLNEGDLSRKARIGKLEDALRQMTITVRAETPQAEKAFDDANRLLADTF